MKKYSEIQCADISLKVWKFIRMEQSSETDFISETFLLQKFIRKLHVL